MSAPDRAHLVDPRQQRIGVVRHVSHTEVVQHKGIGQSSKRQKTECPLPQHHAHGSSLHDLVARRNQPDASGAERQDTGQCQGKITEFRNHQMSFEVGA